MATQFVHSSQVENSAVSRYLQALTFFNVNTSMFRPPNSSRGPRSASTSDSQYKMVCVDCFQAKGERLNAIPCQEPNCRFYMQRTSKLTPTHKTLSISELNQDSYWSAFTHHGAEQVSSMTDPHGVTYPPQYGLPVSSPSTSSDIWAQPAVGSSMLYSSMQRVKDSNQKQRSHSTCFDMESTSTKSNCDRYFRSRLLSLPVADVHGECSELVEDAFVSSPLFREDTKPQRLTPDTDKDSGISSPYGFFDWTDMPRSHLVTTTVDSTTVGNAGCFDMSMFSSSLNSAANVRPQKTSESSSLGVDPLRKFLVNGHFTSLLSSSGETYSRKVFVGGLPPHIDDDDIKSIFSGFGSLTVDWPHKLHTKACIPPKGYAFLLFKEESSVHKLLHSCFSEDDKFFICIPTNTMAKKKVQVRPWHVSDCLWRKELAQPLDSRKAVFVGGVPRPLKATELGHVMNEKYGNVVLVVIDCDNDLKYPKGAACVVFTSHSSYIAAVSARFIQLNYGNMDKKIEVKPYVLDGQMCDNCHGVQCSGKPAPFFCGSVTCLKYFCELCWGSVHSTPGKRDHRPLQKDIGDKPRYY